MTAISPSPALTGLLSSLKTLKTNLEKHLTTQLSKIEAESLRRLAALDQRMTALEHDFGEIEPRETQHRETAEARIESRLQAIERKVATPPKPITITKTVKRDATDRITHVIEEHK